MPRVLDLFCGRFGWGRVFAECGWDVVGIDLVRPPEVPKGCEFIEADIKGLYYDAIRGWMLSGYWLGNLQLGFFDFGCASSPCEEFSLHGMKHFHKNPPSPTLGIELFEHSRKQFISSGIPFLMENVRTAQDFVGQAVHHCGPFYLWGSGVPPLMPRGIIKGGFKGWNWSGGGGKFGSKSKQRKEFSAQMATIPPELAKTVAHYAEGLYAQSRGELTYG